jgi:hypothetical protein
MSLIARQVKTFLEHYEYEIFSCKHLKMRDAFESSYQVGFWWNSKAKYISFRAPDGTGPIEIMSKFKQGLDDYFGLAGKMK